GEMGVKLAPHSLIWGPAFSRRYISLPQAQSRPTIGPSSSGGDPKMGAGFSKKEFVALMAALMAADVLAIDIMLPALPQIGDALRVTNPNDRSLVFTAFLLGFGLPQLIFGPIADRVGRRGVILGGLLAYCVATIVAVLAPNLAVMLVLRFLQGAAAAAIRVG